MLIDFRCLYLKTEFSHFVCCVSLALCCSVFKHELFFILFYPIWPMSPCVSLLFFADVLFIAVKQYTCDRALEFSD